MSIETTVNINDVMTRIQESNELEGYKKNLLEKLLNNDSSFLHYSFGESKYLSADVKYIYTGRKAHVIHQLLNAKWRVIAGFEDKLSGLNIFVISITFPQRQYVIDYIDGFRYENDSRTSFDLLEIYLSNRLDLF